MLGLQVMIRWRKHIFGKISRMLSPFYLNFAVQPVWFEVPGFTLYSLYGVTPIRGVQYQLERIRYVFPTCGRIESAYRHRAIVATTGDQRRPYDVAREQQCMAFYTDTFKTYEIV